MNDLVHALKVTNTVCESVLVTCSIYSVKHYDLRRLPQDNDKTVENVEAVSHVAEETFSEDFH